MSTKINVRSPFYLSYSEPTVPLVELTCALINLNNLSIDQFGSITLPIATYGSIISYTSTAGDFSDGRFATVGTATSRTIIFTISIPPEFSNASNNTINCSASATQPVFNCTGGVTSTGSIPNQSINTQGDTVTIDLSSYFTKGVDPIFRYDILNNYPENFTYILTGTNLQIIGGYKAGVQSLYITATDNDPLTCDATQSVQITTISQETYDCTDSYLSSGGIAQNGTITNPDANGTIVSKSDTSGGTPITSYPANTGATARDVTLYFNITIPSGYSNAGATFICSKIFSQQGLGLPVFTCTTAGITGGAITTSGNISVGVSVAGFITGFDPLKFGTVTTNTLRTVDFEVTIPSSGYSNSGDTPLTCPVTMTQPAAPSLQTCGDANWYRAPYAKEFMTVAQVQAAYPLAPTSWNNPVMSWEAEYNRLGKNSLILGGANQEISLDSLTMQLNINKPVCVGHQDSTTQINTTKVDTGYTRYTKINEGLGSESAANKVESYFIKQSQAGIVEEIWLVIWDAGTFTRIDTIT